MSYAFRLGSYVQNDSVAGLKCMTAKVAVNNHYMSFEQAGVDYVVPGATTFYICKIIFTGDAANSGINILGYANDAVNAGAAAPTSPVIMTNSMLTTAAGGTPSYDVWIPIPTGKYPFFQSNGAVSITIFGVEI